MAFTKAPSTWLGAGYTLTSHVVGLNTNDASSNKTLTQLTDTDAHASTGDIRVVAFSLLEALYQAWITQGTGNQPAKMTISRTVQQGQVAGQVTYTYIAKFTLTPSGTYAVPSE